VPHRRSNTGRTKLAAALLLAIVLVAASCGGSSGGNASGGGSSSSDAGKPVYGGNMTYGIEADPSGGAGGFCLQTGQLAISGMLVARMFYDTLTIPNADGGYSPFLAKSVTPNATYDSWDIKIRPGIKFSDGSALDATVVKNNLDAYRGTYNTDNKPLLFLFVFQNIKDVTVTGPMDVTVTTKTPWPAFPAYLWSSARVGIMGQAQLDSGKNCGLDLIGTGPFIYKKGSYIQGNQIVGTRNPNYWFHDPKTGAKLPYLDSLTLKVTLETSQVLSGLQSGDLQIAHTSDGKGIAQLRKLAKQGQLNEMESDKYGEVAYAMLNNAIPPFNNEHARLAVAYGIDRQAIDDKTQAGIPKIADGPFTKGNVGYLANTDFPKYDPAKARQELAMYKADTGKDLEINLTSTNDSSTLAIAQLVQSQGAKLGVKVNIQQIEQGGEINAAIGGKFQAILWRNHPGGDPDTQYIWWHSGSPVNFSKINDPVIDKDLDQARVETDPAKRQALYEDMNRQFAKEAYNLWTWWTLWTVASSTKVHGILGPDLPDGKKPSPGLATGHFLGGMWLSK
jgi:peptide/nickel transport system substrate-binding protein